MKKIFVLIFIFSLDCVYFNTFYNAKIYFKEAEKLYKQQGKLTTQSRAAYEKTIEKCAKIIQFHPNSKYIDDALFLMGVSYARLGEREKASRKFDELMSYFPQSPYIPQVKLEYGRILLDLGEWIRAEHLLSEVKGKYQEEASLLLAKSLYIAGEYQEAYERFKIFLEEHKKSNLKKEILYWTALSAKSIQKYDEAEQFLEEYLKFFLTQEEVLEAKELLGDILRENGKFEKALEVYKSLDLAPTSPESRKIDIKIALTYESMKDLEKAIQKYEDVIDRSSNSIEALEARYRLGKLYESLDSLELALKFYNEASKMYVSSQYRQKAAKRAKALEELTQLGDQEKADSRYRLAEIYLFELGKPEEALTLYRSIIDDFQDSPIIPKVLYSLIFAHLYVEKDTTQARKYFDELVSKFGDTYYAEKAQEYFSNILQKSPP